MENNKNYNELPDINDENEKEYWIEYKKTLSPQIKEALIVKYKYLLEVAANELKSNIGKGRLVRLDYDDLVCLGYLGLLEAIDKYPHDKDVKFKSYAFVRIQRAIYDIENIYYELKNNISNDLKIDEIKDGIFSIALKEIPTKERIVLILYYCQNITLKEVSIIMNMSKSELSKFCKKSINDLRKKYKIFYRRNLEYKKKYKKIVKALKKLPNKYRAILELYYIDNLSLKEISEKMELSKSEVSTLHKKAIIDLKNILNNNKKHIK
ncbi:sigma-70 family RNA polymerase sigma factor [uncultured Brachyspira sp.]|uniref:sigma-70 family RNA polymerase sigma factor n=1 Tax=uncultured Brachyspira sp. TaxID=221953 RepID=UPI00259B0F27|nr:sigma-70 family RNA polymerase sigma factor [uncultured Brachyspira sp.]